MNHWLMKSEPDECSIDDALAANGRLTPWSGVRNYQARNFMKDRMKVGDGVLFYHSSCPEPGIAGLAEVASAAYTDASQFARKNGYPAPGEPAVDHSGYRGRVEPHSKAALKNDTLLRALARQPTEYTPIWLMRQAGRYLPEYNATRAKAGSFLALAKSPALATEVTLQPLERFPLDAAILFSDILTIPDAMGLGLYFVEGEGPKFAHPIRAEADIERLAVPDLDRLRYVFDAVAEIRRALQGRVPLIGFSGSPWTLACYMVEGGASDDYRRVKTLLYARPDLMHRVLAINAAAVAGYLNAQIEAGAQAVMVFDSWGGVLADGAFQAFSLAYTRHVLEQVHRVHDGRRAPHIVFTLGGGPWLGAR